MPSNSLTTLRAGAALLAAAILVTGCTADYLNRRDRVTLAAGDAVRANLERETANPSKASMYDVTGLGKDGVVIPAEEETAPVTAITLTATAP